MPDALTIVILFSIATGVAIAVRRINVPYTVALALVGVALGSTRVGEADLLRRDLLFSLFLPALVFEAAYHLKLSELRERVWALIALAVPGVALGSLLTAVLLVFARPALLPFGGALVFGAIVAATDPIAVVALFRKLGAPRGLTVLVEGESLLNDGTAIAVFTLAVAGWTSAGGAVFGFARILLVGTALGVVIGAAASLVLQRVDDAMIEITVTVIAAYGSFAFAEHLGGSGVIATVAAALLCGRQHRTHPSVAVFWEYAAFAFNSLIFLSMGFSVRIGELAASWQGIALAYGAILITRAVLVAAVTLGLRRTKSAVPPRWSSLLVWGGVRGALSMVLALSLPDTFPNRGVIITLTSGVVMTTLILQGATMSALMTRLGLEARP